MGPLPQDMEQSDFHHLSMYNTSKVSISESFHLRPLLISESTFSAMFVVINSCIGIHVESRERAG
jgi:hypothetical protein